MNLKEQFRIHKAVEYIKHASFFDDGFNWEYEDVESDDLKGILAYYGIFIDSFCSEAVNVLRNELSQLAEASQTAEMLRLYGE
jgi:hypothetical protein